MQHNKLHYNVIHIIPGAILLKIIFKVLSRNFKFAKVIICEKLLCMACGLQRISWMSSRTFSLEQ